MLLCVFAAVLLRSTHLAGATLDLVYVRNEFMEQFNLLDYVINIYFSDHDAIQFHISLKTE